MKWVEEKNKKKYRGETYCQEVKFPPRINKDGSKVLLCTLKGERKKWRKKFCLSLKRLSLQLGRMRLHIGGELH